MNPSRIIKPAAMAFSLSALAAAMLPTTASAHGYMVYPTDYARSCHVGTTTDPTLCNGTISAQHMQIVQGNAGNRHREVVPENLCSANMGGPYAALDVPGANRFTTTLVPDAEGYVEFQYMQTAAHKSWYYDIFITRDGFNPDTDVLTWADVERLDVIDLEGKSPVGPNSLTTYKVKWPEDKTGKRVIYQIWQRADVGHRHHEVLGAPPQNVWDSPEAFYSCANVFVDGDGVVPEPGSQWLSDERFAADKGELQPGDTVRVRIMVDGSTRITKELLIDTRHTTPEAWKLTLASMLNNDPATEDLLRVGIRNGDDEVEQSGDHERNRIYFKEEGFSHVLDVMPAAQSEFEFSWENLQPVYEKLVGTTLTLPLDLAITKGQSGEYHYTAHLFETTQRSGAPVILKGIVGDNQAFTIARASHYSATVKIGDEYGNTGTQVVHFLVNDSEKLPPVPEPEPGNTSVTWVNNSGLPVMSALQHGIWGTWVSNGASLTATPDSAIFNQAGWEVGVGESTTFGALLNGVEYLNCGTLPLAGNIRVSVNADSSCVAEVVEDETQVTWHNETNLPVMTALQAGVWGEWVQAGGELTAGPDAAIFNQAGWAVGEGETTILGALINGVQYVECGTKPLTGAIEVTVRDGSCSID